MTTELTTSGLTVDTFLETLAAIEDDQKSAIAATLDLSTSSPLGQINRLVARAIRLQAEALEAIYAGLDPDSATGDVLDRIAALTGSYREPATKASVTLDVDLDAATYAAGALVASVANRPADRFVNRDEIVSAGGSNLAVFEAETAGFLQAPTGPAGTYVIAGPVSGWNSISDATDGTPGADAESDADFRLRRALEIEQPGSTSAPGIAADISSNITDVTAVTVLENDTNATVDTIPPHSIEAVVFGPASPTAADNLLVATQIFDSKAAGIGTSGNTTVTVTDSQGIDHDINFTRPTSVTVDVSVTLEYVASTYEGDTTVEDLIELRIQELDPGFDVTWARVAGWVNEVEGVTRITALTIDGVSLTDFVITDREKAQPGTISVTSSVGGV